MSLSRSEQFCEVFGNILSKHFITTGKVCIWNLKLLTEHTRKNIHNYHLVFPAKYLAYHLDKRVVLPDGTTEGPGPIYLPQEIPPMEEFIREAKAYFGKFAYVEDGVILSGVKICAPIEEPSGNKIFNIIVVYHKKYQPYPIPLTREQELEKKLKEAESKSAVLEQQIQAYKCVVHTQNKKIQAQTERFDKLAKLFRKMAKDAYAKEDPQDCPICLDPIDMENLHITLCGHTLCTVCNMKCTKCPLCRGEN